MVAVCRQRTIKLARLLVSAFPSFPSSHLVIKDRLLRLSVPAVGKGWLTKYVQFSFHFGSSAKVQTSPLADGDKIGHFNVCIWDK